MKCFQQNARFRLVVISAAALLLLHGCASPWPELPPHRYSGKTIHQATSDAMGDVHLVAIRPEMRGWGWMIASEAIGHTDSDTDGRFELMTDGGWAYSICAQTADGRYSGDIKAGRHTTDGLIIELSPSLTTTTSRLTHPDEADMREQLRELVLKIIQYHDHHPETFYLSPRQYVGRGVFDQSELKFLESHHTIFSYPERKGFRDKMFVAWGGTHFNYQGLDVPVCFTPYTMDFFRPD